MHSKYTGQDKISVQQKINVLSSQLRAHSYFKVFFILQKHCKPIQRPTFQTWAAQSWPIGSHDIQPMPVGCSNLGCPEPANGSHISNLQANRSVIHSVSGAGEIPQWGRWERWCNRSPSWRSLAQHTNTWVATPPEVPAELCNKYEIAQIMMLHD